MNEKCILQEVITNRINTFLFQFQNCVNSVTKNFSQIHFQFILMLLVLSAWLVLWITNSIAFSKLLCLENARSVKIHQ